MQRSAEVKAYVERMWEQFNTGNIETIDEYVSADHNILGIGTDPREWWAGSDALRSAWKSQIPEMRAAGMKFKSGDVEAFSEGSVGWFADRLTIQAPDGSALPARLTGVCRQEGGAWKLVQFHLSFGAMNEEALGEPLTI
jgi:hypothetical protein